MGTTNGMYILGGVRLPRCLTHTYTILCDLQVQSLYKQIIHKYINKPKKYFFVLTNFIFRGHRKKKLPSPPSRTSLQNPSNNTNKGTHKYVSGRWGLQMACVYQGGSGYFALTCTYTIFCYLEACIARKLSMRWGGGVTLLILHMRPQHSAVYKPILWHIQIIVYQVSI